MKITDNFNICLRVLKMEGKQKNADKLFFFDNEISMWSNDAILPLQSQQKQNYYCSLLQVPQSTEPKKKNEMKTPTHFDGMADNPTLISKLTIFLYIYFISIWHSFFFSFAHKYSKQTQKLGNRALIENENEKRPIHTCIWLFLAQPFHFFCISFSFCPFFCI